MDDCKLKNPHIQNIKICFLSITDLERIPRIPGHVFAYDLLNNYITSDYYPYRSFADYVRERSGVKAEAFVNPYVRSEAEKGTDFCAQVSFGQPLQY